MEAVSAPELQRLLSLSHRAVTDFSRGGRLVWHRWGAGEPLVLLHGGYGSWRHWARNIDELSRSYELWVPDLPGLGVSGAAPDDAGPAEIAGIVLEGLQRLGLGAIPAVAGFSFGSIVGGHMASQAPVSSLVLIGPSGLGATRSSIALEKPGAGGPPQDVATAHRRNLAVLMLSDPAKIDALAVAIQTANVAEARFKSVRFSREDVLLEALRRSRASRISAIWGANDAVAKGALGERISLLQAIPRFEGYDLVAGAGHWVMYEAPGRFDEALLRQLRPRQA
jgi:pimeloyl-ACP methyl ester carboxylesterase